jgi:octaprenyl-diphosphate synthase
MAPNASVRSAANRAPPAPFALVAIVPSQHFKTLLAPEMAEVDRVLRASLDSDVVLIRQVADYIIGGGGKRLRPALVLLSARACGYDGPHRFTLAAVIEMIHTATLLHDDVVDESKLRRGHATANATFGNAASVLVGDFLYSRAFQLMVSVGSMRVLEILAQATNIIAEGEVLQLMNTRNPNLDEAAYLKVIQRKTAKLFEAGAQLGAVLAGADVDREAALARYGMHLGTSFQLVDDVLDYKASAEELGKNLGDDLAEGKPTLPVIYAMAHAPSTEAVLLRGAIETGGLDALAEITRTIESAGGLEYTARLAQREKDLAAAALSRLPESAYREALGALAEFAVARTY